MWPHTASATEGSGCISHLFSIERLIKFKGLHWLFVSSVPRRDTRALTGHSGVRRLSLHRTARTAQCVRPASRVGRPGARAAGAPVRGGRCGGGYLGFHKLHFPPCLPAASTAPAPAFPPAKQETPPAASMPLAHHRVPQVPLQQRPRLEPVAAPARSRGNPLDAAHPSSRSAVHRARSSRSSARLEAVAHLVGMVVGMAVGRSAIPGTRRIVGGA